MNDDYKYGFNTNLEQEFIPKGISIETVQLISSKKNEPQWLLDFRLKGYHKWLEAHQQGQEPKWADLKIEPIDYQNIIYFAEVKSNRNLKKLSEYKETWLDNLI